jgi:signal transduction histidine kinase
MIKGYLFASFIPWIFFSIFYTPGADSSALVSLIALFGIVYLGYHELRKGFVLPWGEALFFAFSALNGWLHFWPWAEVHAYLLVNSALAFIVLFSMLIGQPFTLQYAREKVSPEYWNAPLFLKINWVLTSIWAVLMITLALPSYFLSQAEIQSHWFYNYGLSVLCVFIGIQCNHLIPAWFQKNTKSK